MRKISLWLFILVFTASRARAQDTATQQQLEELSGRIQNVLELQEAQTKRLDALEKEISELSDKVSMPQVNNSASADDLKKLAGQVQDLAKKQQDDNDLIMKQIEKLGQISAGPSTGHKPKAGTDTPPTGAENPTPPPNVPQKGYYYTIKDGDRLPTIARRIATDQHVKVTTAQILAANPGLDPTKLYIGKKIFIPDPNAK